MQPIRTAALLVLLRRAQAAELATAAAAGQPSLLQPFLARACRLSCELKETVRLTRQKCKDYNFGIVAAGDSRGFGLFVAQVLLPTVAVVLPKAPHALCPPTC